MPVVGRGQRPTARDAGGPAPSRRDRRRTPLRFVCPAALLVAALVVGGSLGLVLGLVGLLLLADALVPDFHTPLASRELPQSKRDRMDGR